MIHVEEKQSSAILKPLQGQQLGRKASTHKSS